MTATAYTDPPVARQALHRRTLTAVMASQVFSGAGLAAGVTVGALLAADMLGTSSLSGLPAPRSPPAPPALRSWSAGFRSASGAAPG
jgi:hypothetical protein